jgi:SRSO17 transposase
MDAADILSLEPMLAEFLGRFNDCFQRRDTRGHFPVYIRGQLSELERKSVEPIALAAGVPVRTLQEFLTHLVWDDERMAHRVREMVATEQADPQAIGIVDETGWVKKGDKTPGVQRQYCGAVGKQENCIVTVHLAYATDNFHCLLDGELYLPQSWDEDRERCREAGIPDGVRYRPKWQIALELLDHAEQQGLHFAWLTFDEGYGGKPVFLTGLEQRKQKYVAEVPKNFVVWAEQPRVTYRRYRKNRRGAGRRTPRLASGSAPPRTVEDLAFRHPQWRHQEWQLWHVKDSHKGPVVWEVRHGLVFVKDQHGLPKGPYHLLVCRNELTGEMKYFLSNAPAQTPVIKLLEVAFSRWHVERSIQDHKGEVGLDHWEGRRWIGLKRHLTLSMVSYLFLALARQQLGKKFPS